MKRYTIVGLPILGFGTYLFMAGCATPHYKVTDPQSGNTYYTERIENLSGGSVKLKDARSGNTVTIQNSEVKEISPEAYKEGVASPATPPAPAAAPTPAAAPAAPAAAPAPAAPAPKPAPSGTP